jgi:hypothetical protein
MPEKGTIRRAQQKKREGKAATTQAGEFVREEMHHAERGKHRVKSRKQAIAIGLSKARRAGVKVPAKKGASARRGGARKTAAGGGARKTAAGRGAARAGGRSRSGARSR